MKIEVTYNNDKDILGNLVTMEDFEQMLAKRVAANIKEYPIEFAKEMKDSGLIDDLQYKEMGNRKLYNI